MNHLDKEKGLLEVFFIQRQNKTEMNIKILNGKYNDREIVLGIA